MVSGVFVFREPVDSFRILGHRDIRASDIVAVRMENIMANAYKTSNGLVGFISLYKHVS